MANYMIAMIFVALILVGGAVFDYRARARHQVVCERAGGVYVIGLSGLTCATAQQVRQ